MSPDQPKKTALDLSDADFAAHCRKFLRTPGHEILSAIVARPECPDALRELHQNLQRPPGASDENPSLDHQSDPKRDLGQARESDASQQSPEPSAALASEAIRHEHPSLSVTVNIGTLNVNL